MRFRSRHGLVAQCHGLAAAVVVAVAVAIPQAHVCGGIAEAASGRRLGVAARRGARPAASVPGCWVQGRDRNAERGCGGGRLLAMFCVDIESSGGGGDCEVRWNRSVEA